MIPEFTDIGLLPPGIHWTTIDEVVSKFGFNQHRKKLLVGLKKAIGALKSAGCKEIYLDGSFVTNKEFPNDYDACWFPVGVNPSKLDSVFLDFKNKRAAQKAKYMGEFLVGSMNADSSTKGLSVLNFFQIDKETGAIKGIIGLKL